VSQRLARKVPRDYLGYYSGNNSTSGNRPQLVVTYQ